MPFQIREMQTKSIINVYYKTILAKIKIWHVDKPKLSYMMDGGGMNIIKDEHTLYSNS